MGYFQNPPFVKDQNVLITVTFQASPVYSVTNSIIVSGYVAGTIYSQSLLQDSFKRAAKTNYTIYFNIKNTILLNGVITLSFPLESSLNYIQNVYWKSYTDESEYTVSFSNTSSTISLKSLFTIHALSPNASGVLMIRIDAIQNPSILINTTSITIKTTNNQDNAIDQVIVLN